MTDVRHAEGTKAGLVVHLRVRHGWDVPSPHRWTKAALVEAHRGSLDHPHENTPETPETELRAMWGDR